MRADAPTWQKAYVDPETPETYEINRRYIEGGPEVSRGIDNIAVGALMDVTFMGAGKLFHAAGIQTEEHFLIRLATRGGRGVTEEAAMRAYNTGRLFFDPETRNFIRRDTTSGVSVVVSKSQNGRAITVFEGNPSPRWVSVPWRPGTK